MSTLNGSDKITMPKWLWALIIATAVWCLHTSTKMQSIESAVKHVNYRLCKIETGGSLGCHEFIR